MKKYIKPEVKVSICDSIELFCTSGGVKTGSSLGDEFFEGDISYVREGESFDIWNN